MRQMPSLTIIALAGLATLARALPNRPEFENLHSDGPGSMPCFSKYCKEPDMPYKRVQRVSPRLQWGDAGGYCGSMAIQEIALGRGVWISQQQVRDHTVPGGGNDEEILATNIEPALTNLKLTWSTFGYDQHPAGQADAYRQWIKEQLTSGHGVVWMIMLSGGRYPVYPALTMVNGVYSHVEPVYGILSNRPLNDTAWSDDDVLVHSTDAASTESKR